MAKILLVGSGYMAREYCKVLYELERDVIVIGRGQEKVEALKKDYPSFKFVSGGVAKYLNEGLDSEIQFAINTLPVEQLYSSTYLLMNSGIRKILVEKPGALEVTQLSSLKVIAMEKNAEIQVAYNRRFYKSVMSLKQRVLNDGGVISLHFEFTEWINTINPSSYHESVLSKWILSNSSHVIDTAFFIVGLPKVQHCNVAGKNLISWHRSGSVFTGSGISERDIPFTFHSNWNSAGRWSVEILTSSGKYFLQPMERLRFQPKGTLRVEDIDLDYSYDINFKPGLYVQTENFLNGKLTDFVSLNHQLLAISIYNEIGGYH